MNIMKCNPRMRMTTDFDRLVNGFFNQNWNITHDHINVDAPAVDIEEKNDKFIITADLPGLTKKDVKITILDGVLSLTGELSDEQEKEETNYHYRERKAGSFSRSFRLPDTVNEEKIEATFKHGVLKVILNKHDEILPKEQEIKIS